MSKDQSMRKLLADKVRLWMARVPEAGTQAKLATRAKMSQSSVHRVLFMDTEPELATAYKLAQAFGISVSELLADEDPKACGAFPYELSRYQQLPEGEKEQIRAFADFIFAKHDLGIARTGEAETLEKSISATPDERAIVGRVTQRSNLTTDTLSTHETEKKHNEKATRRRAKSSGN